MLKLILWKNKKEIKHVEVSEGDLLAAMEMWLLINGYVSLESTWEVEIESVTR